MNFIQLIYEKLEMISSDMSDDCYGYKGSNITTRDSVQSVQSHVTS